MPLLRFAVLVAGALTLVASVAGSAQEAVHFSSLDDNRTLLDGYLFRPAGDGRHAAVLFLPGCGGMWNRTTGRINTRETDWASRLTAQGYVVLIVDSLMPRRHGEMCSVQGFDLTLYRERPKDAYGALAWLQAQSFVRADRIGVIGWSQGGGVIMLGLGTPSLGRPAAMTQLDFRAAVAFYPGSCNVARLPAGWTMAIPLLVLTGADDVWTPLAPCQSILGAAAARAAPVTMQVYPGAVHDFDWPDIPRRERPEYRTAAGVVPITGTDPVARADALQRVPGFLARYLSQ